MRRRQAASYLRVSGLGQVHGDGFRRQRDRIAEFRGLSDDGDIRHPGHLPQPRPSCLRFLWRQRRDGLAHPSSQVQSHSRRICRCLEEDGRPYTDSLPRPSSGFFRRRRTRNGGPGHGSQHGRGSAIACCVLGCSRGDRLPGPAATCARPARTIREGASSGRGLPRLVLFGPDESVTYTAPR